VSERWSIGDLARASGVTVRTLYYYDEIGLVPASERTPSGHRRYTDDDVRRLYRVRALAQLGLSLDEVATVLGGAEDLSTLRDLLHAQQADLDTKARQLDDLRRRVRGLVEQLDGESVPPPEQFLATLELTAQLYGALSPGQHDALAKRRAELGGDQVEALKSELFTVLRELHRHLTGGTPPGDPAVRELAGRWQRVSAAFRTGQPEVDAQIGAASGAMWQEHGARIGQYLSERVDWMAPGDMAALMAYVRRAS
jgi:MerR family transcriptional regulator, thiopeptide resistance regulator